MNTREVGDKLVELCRQGRNVEAVDSLYSNDVVSVEAFGNDQMPAEIRGIDKVRGKNEWWLENNEIHTASAEGPFPHNDKFAVKYHYDATAKTGDRKGQRYQMEEVAVYTVQDGKIIREEFFYTM
jgi:ketosteroid isomerase-like protein